MDVQGRLRVNHVGSTGPGGRLLVLLHGYGADEHDLAPLASHIDPEGAFTTICPRGPYDVPGAGAGWYERSEAGLIDAATFVASVDAIDDVIDSACAEQGLDRASAAIVGFSQGGAMALATSLRAGGGVRPAAVACLSGSLQDQAGVDYDFSTEPVPRVLVQHGSLDPVVPIERGRRTCKLLRDAGVAHTWLEYPMPHSIVAESANDLGRWLNEP